jgi:hypothetical protein
VVNLTGFTVQLNLIWTGKSREALWNSN